MFPRLRGEVAVVSYLLIAKPLGMPRTAAFSFRTAILVLLCGLPITSVFGCASVTSKLSAQHSLATGCPQSQLTVKPLGGIEYLVAGCDEATVYRCTGSSACQPDSNASSDKRLVPAVVASDANATEPRTSAPRREKTKTGAIRVVADIELEPYVTVHLAAEPSNPEQPMQIGFLLRDNEDALKDCNVDLLLNGERVGVGQTQRQRKGTFVALTVKPPQTFVNDLGVAQRVTVGICERRFSLDPGTLAKLRAFAARYDEELSLLGDPKTGTSSNLVAPSGGWQTWIVPTTKPSAVTEGKELSGSELYELLKRSVYRVDALQGEGSSQGSAVAVGASELLTNCHVVEGARKIIVANEGREYVAKLSRSLPSADRCVLTANGAELVPVRGVRSYSDLRIGEPLYTLGAPSGLELSLSNGILSGLRQEEPIGRMIQTTAPISPGSSGGGLFDSRGNLVGITTLVLVGRHRLNQALNFAIAAESFWLEGK